MSILVIEVKDLGIVIGADRNLTHSNTQTGTLLGQTQRTKIIRLPQNRGIIGYVGCARVGNLFTDEWLQEFVYRNVKFESLESLGNTLAKEIQKQRIMDEGTDDAQGILIHLVGFEKDKTDYYPVVFLITNIHGLKDNGEYENPIKEYRCSEHIKYENGITHQNIRTYYKSGHFGWFHQGFDLGAYNIIDNKLNETFHLLETSGHPKHPTIKSIKDAEPFVKMKVLSYGAYFSSFFLPNEQYVGGGADVLSIPWPEDPK